jgi:hypothetical protein
MIRTHFFTSWQARVQPRMLLPRPDIIRKSQPRLAILLALQHHGRRHCSWQTPVAGDHAIRNADLNTFGAEAPTCQGCWSKFSMLLVPDPSRKSLSCKLRVSGDC